MRIVSCFLISLLTGATSICQGQIKVTLSLVVNSVSPEDESEEAFEEKAILIEVKNTSNQSLILLQSKPVRDHVTVLIDSIDMKASSKKTVKNRTNSKPNFNGLYQKIIDSNKENQPLFREIPLTRLEPLGVYVHDPSTKTNLYGILIQPDQVYRDLKYFRKELQLSGCYRYRYVPLPIEVQKQPVMLSLDGKSYRIVLPEEIVSNEFILTTFRD